MRCTGRSYPPPPPNACKGSANDSLYEGNVEANCTTVGDRYKVKAKPVGLEVVFPPFINLTTRGKTN